jgi:hypothetical protein
MPFATARKNAMLGTIPNTVYVQGHSGDPGTDGTANVLSGNARIAVVLQAASNGQRIPNAGTYELDVQAGQTISWVSYWDAASSGTYEGKDQLDAPEAFAGAGKYRLTSQTFSITD